MTGGFFRWEYPPHWTFFDMVFCPRQNDQSTLSYQKKMPVQTCLKLFFIGFVKKNISPPSNLWGETDLSFPPQKIHVLKMKNSSVFCRVCFGIFVSFDEFVNRGGPGNPPPLFGERKVVSFFGWKKTPNVVVTPPISQSRKLWQCSSNNFCWMMKYLLIFVDLKFREVWGVSRERKKKLLLPIVCLKMWSPQFRFGWKRDHSCRSGGVKKHKYGRISQSEPQFHHFCDVFRFARWSSNPRDLPAH